MFLFFFKQNFEIFPVEKNQKFVQNAKNHQVKLDPKNTHN